MSVHQEHGFKFYASFLNTEENNSIPEYHIIKWCEQYLSRKGVFVDVGAGIGYYSIILSKECKATYAFEHRKPHCDSFETNVCINGALNVVLENTKLSDKPDRLTVYHSIIPNEVLLEEGDTTVTATSIETINVRTLDSYNITDKIDLIHIDDDNTLAVLKGSSKTLLDNNFPPIVFYKPDSPDKLLSMNFLKHIGYSLFPIMGGSDLYLASDHPFHPKTSPEDKLDFDVIKLCNDYVSGQLDEEDRELWERWDVWYELAKHFSLLPHYKLSRECCVEGLARVPENNKIKCYLFYEYLAQVCHHLNRFDEGYIAGERVVLCGEVEWKMRNDSLNKLVPYMDPLPFKEVIDVAYDLPAGYIGTSSSIVFKDGFKLNLRAVNYSINPNGSYAIRDPENVVRTKNFLLNLDDNLEVTDGLEVFDVSGVERFPRDIQGMEDIRLIGWNEKLSMYEFLCVYLEVNPSRTPQICYGQYNEKGEVTRITPLKVTKEVQCEKNWIPFIGNGELYFIYSFQPFRIYHFDRETSMLEQVTHSVLTEDTNIDGFRGSGSMLPYKGGWLSTIHQVYHDSPRKYFHRFVYFNYAMTTIEYSRLFYFEGPQIEYTLSLCHSDKGLLLPYSIKDNVSKIGVVDYDLVDKYLGL